MIAVKEAIQRAAAFAEDIYGGRPAGFRVEEVDSADDLWLITLSFEVEKRATILSHAASLTTLERQFKIFQVDKSDGSVRSMKIRQVG
ncbi:MAG TPA: hypothetical protein VIM11_24240 [Tepidisphaeraceae bacterium]|jgi:hypothetical protein